MQNHKLCIVLIATLITISLNSCEAQLTCATGPPEKPNPTQCDEGVTQCFVKADATGDVTRGCATVADICKDNASCVLCDKNNCNANLMCKSCDGSQAECGTTNATAVANQYCSTTTEVCFNQLNENGTITRGCGEPCTADTCTGCTTKDLCNVGFYPADRRQCYQCDNSESCNTVNNATMLKACPIYKATGQKCYTIGTSATAMQRGCSSDPTNNKCGGETPDASCVFCDNENGCNNRVFEQVLGKCYKCNNAAACIGSQLGGQAEDCPPSKYTQTVNSCYTQRAADGSVQRGCTNERTDPCTTEIGCSSCTGDACNSDTNKFSCLVCRSDNYAPCRKAAVGPTECVNTGDEKTKQQCFEGEWDGVVLRGCLADAGPLMVYQCLNDADTRCTACKTANCNIKSFNGASSLQHMSFGLLGVIVIVKHYL